MAPACRNSMVTVALALGIMFLILSTHFHVEASERKKESKGCILLNVTTCGRVVKADQKISSKADLKGRTLQLVNLTDTSHAFHCSDVTPE